MDKLQTPKLTGDDLLKSIITYDAPPPGFDPFTADPRLLLLHGYPRRPDPMKEPHLKILWEKAFTSKPQYVKAGVVIDTVMAGRTRPLISAKPNDSTSVGRFGWAGLVIPVAASQKVNMVYSELTVPQVALLPANQSGFPPQTVGFWVGIDGQGNATNQVLQAGIAATVTTTTASYWIWNEWYPADPVRITTLAIKPGDDITIMVCATQPSVGTSYIFNKTTNQFSSLSIPAPAGFVTQGTSAEWIVEGSNFTQTPGRNTIPVSLPNFSSVTFSNCIADVDYYPLNLTSGYMVDSGGNGNPPDVLTNTSVATSVTVQWLKEF